MSLALKLALSPLLVAQGLWTRRRTPRLPEAEGDREGEVGEGGETLRVLIVGDSSAAGVGVKTQDAALAGQLTRALAQQACRRVRWQLVARSGITSAEALDLVRDVRPAPADLAVAVLGVNDVVGQVPTHRAIAAREALADWLIANLQVRHVAFAALPAVHQFPALPQPLRWIAGADARRHDRSLAQWAATRGSLRGDVSHVPMPVPLGRQVMAHDGFHPAEPVYRACGELLALHLAQRLAPPRPTTTGDPR